MKTLQVLALASSLVAAGFLVSVCPLAAQSSRTIEGELVVTGAPNHFRIVGQSGSYVAPSSVVALDGHTVRVDLSDKGTVTQVAEVPVPIAPVTHGISTARGELVVQDAASRRFAFAGDSQVYTAPAGIDLAQYAGHMVEIKLDENGGVTEFHLLPSAGTSLNQAVPIPSCNYSGEGYSAGSVVCQAGTQYRCDGSDWRSLGSSCTSTAPVAMKRALRSCMVGGATVANASSVCRDGMTMRCDDGTWISTQTACR